MPELEPRRTQIDIVKTAMDEFGIATLIHQPHCTEYRRAEAVLDAAVRNASAAEYATAVAERDAENRSR